MTSSIFIKKVIFMATIKKKDLKNYKPSALKSDKDDIEELVDADGSPIEGDRNATNDSEIETAPQGTSDDHAKAAIQPNRYYYGVGGTAYSHGARVQSESEEDIAEAMMKDMIENLIGQRAGDTDMVKRYRDTDVNRNDIPDLEELATSYQKPVVAKKAQEVLKTMEMNNLSGEEIGIVINYILTNVDLSQVPQDYKRLLRKNL